MSELALRKSRAVNVWKLSVVGIFALSAAIFIFQHYPISSFLNKKGSDINDVIRGYCRS